jgi:hypothetical protein
MAARHETKGGGPATTTDVGHGRRRGRRAGGTRRTPRAAIVAGALAAASIPLWPSAAGAGASPFDEYKSESHTFRFGDVSCPVTVTSYRIGERLDAATVVNSSETLCNQLSLQVRMEYVPLGSDSVKSSTANGTGSLLSVTVDGVRDLTQSRHLVGLQIPWFGCECTTYTLNHPNSK